MLSCSVIENLSSRALFLAAGCRGSKYYYKVHTAQARFRIHYPAGEILSRRANALYFCVDIEHVQSSMHF